MLKTGDGLMLKGIAQRVEASITQKLFSCWRWSTWQFKSEIFI